MYAKECAPKYECVAALLCLIMSCCWPASANQVLNPRTGSLDTSIINALSQVISGDTLLVYAGTYTEPGITITQANISIIGTSPTSVIVQAATSYGLATSRVFEITSGATDTVLSGLTIRHGNESNGAGIDSRALNTHITNCIIMGNKSSASGGGIYFREDANITSSVIFSNEASSNGGGLYFHQNGVIDQCTVAGNYSGNNGGGVYGENTIAEDCIIENNRAGDMGGGTYNVFIDNSIIRNNQARSGGGLAGIGPSRGGASNCTIIGNIAYTSGGGGSGEYIDNCLVISNRAGYGGGIFSTPVISDSTISWNIATNADGGGIYNVTIATNCQFDSNMSASNGGAAARSNLQRSRLVNNQAGAHGGGAYKGFAYNCLISMNSASNSGGGGHSMTLINSTVVSNLAGVAGGGVSSSTNFNTIIFYNAAASDPDWMIPGLYNTVCMPATLPFPGLVTNAPLIADFETGQLDPHSPCIDAGNNSYYPDSDQDYVGYQRVFNGQVDIGATEFQGYPIMSVAGPNGSIDPSGVVNVASGSNVTFTVSPQLYYEISDVTSNGVSQGAISVFTWPAVSSTGIVDASFAAQVTSHGTPHWWLAQYGYTSQFEVAASADQDEDGLFTWQEYGVGTVPTNSNTDGDQFSDGVEITAGADPLVSDQTPYGAIIGNPEVYGLYDTNSIGDLSYGQVMLNANGSNIVVALQMQKALDLNISIWTNLMPVVMWTNDADDDVSFYRFWGAPPD